jgi:hypothetical protein
VAVRLHAGLEVDGAILVAEGVGGLRRSVEPLGDVVDVRHRRRERDDPWVLQPTEPRDGDLEDGAARFTVEEVHLVDDDTVYVSHERVPRSVVFPRRAVGLLRGRDEHVRALGPPWIEVALAGDDVH